MIYLYLNGKRRGPFKEEQVQAFVRDGLVELTDLASSEPGAELKPLGFFGSFGPATPEPGKTESSHTLPLLSLGSYARATLAPNESPVFRTSLHWIVFARFAFMALLAFLFLALPFAIAIQALTGSQMGWFVLPLPVFMMVAPAVAYAGSELVITNARVLIKTGVIRRQSLEMFVAKIESVAIDQGFLGRLFDYGTVVVRGTGGFEERFENIARPLEFRNWAQRMQQSPLVPSQP